ncbi:RRM domain-containing protein [Durusdinium trenchii]|uniref:RRM domain-containing protein n=1 Tax=Durusdinium trenchii TaxID=1381693 RepID=A0ABP0KSA1_9DINO
MSSAQRKRFLRALARNPEDSIDAKPSREEPSAPSEPAKPVVEPVKGVRFDFDTLSRFQGIHGMGLSPVSEEVNFRKRPNYDGSRRRHMRLQRARTSHTENGLSRARVEGLIRRDCCRCQRKICFAKYRQNMVDQLLKFLKIFWSLARAAQDSFVLFVAGDKANCRRSWYVLGKQVSPACAMALLGMGNDRLSRILQFRRDMRKSDGNVIKRTARKRRAINMFLLGVYMKSAGMLPNKFQRASRSKKSHEKITVVFESVDDHESEAESTSDEGDHDEVIPEEPIEKDQELRLHVLGMNSFFTSCVETNFASNIKNLPVRYLPPGTIHMLWMNMQTERKGDGISYNHFWRTFRQGWSNLLRFVAPSTHGACDVCCGFKSDFKRQLDPQTKFETARCYRHHLEEVGRDRDLEQFLQASNTLERSGHPLAMHWDGMDQSKWRIPRYHGPNGQRPLKSTMNLQRPQLKVQGIWIFNVLLDLYVLDPRVAADSTTVLETASRSIDFALQLCDELRVPRPNQLLVWADNCVRENKNGQLLRFLSWLYQIYGLIATAMKYIDILSDGLDVAAKIENVLNRIGVRHWIGQKARIRVQYISGVREFKNWLSAAPVTFAGGLKTDETGLHAFIFMRRSDLPANINIVAHGRGAAYETHESDVILMVKRNASDDGLCQEPMLAFPYRYVARFGPLPAEPRSLKLIKPAKKKDYLALAQILLRTNPSEATRRAVEFLVGICTGLDPEAVPTIKWLEEEPRAPAIDLGGLSVLDRVAPAMRLRAHLRP